jgi:hypothetical protein
MSDNLARYGNYVVGVDPAHGDDYSAVVVMTKGNAMNGFPDELVDLVTAVVYDTLIAEGVIQKFTIDDAIALALEDVEKECSCSCSDDCKAIAHAVIKDLITSICPAVEDCFNLGVNGTV